MNAKSEIIEQIIGLGRPDASLEQRALPQLESLEGMLQMKVSLLTAYIREAFPTGRIPLSGDVEVLENSSLLFT